MCRLVFPYMLSFGCWLSALPFSVVFRCCLLNLSLDVAHRCGHWYRPLFLSLVPWHFQSVASSNPLLFFSHPLPFPSLAFSNRFAFPTPCFSSVPQFRCYQCTIPLSLSSLMSYSITHIAIITHLPQHFHLSPFYFLSFHPPHFWIHLNFYSTSTLQSAILTNNIPQSRSQMRLQALACSLRSTEFRSCCSIVSHLQYQKEKASKIIIDKQIEYAR